MKSNININNRSQAFSALICSMLRDYRVTENMDKNETDSYMYKAGVVLHNITGFIYSSGSLFPETLTNINQLDPSAKNKSWGDWCEEFCANCNQELPEIPDSIAIKPLKPI